jgi:hypothetical protein
MFKTQIQKLEFRDIVLQHIKKILEISSVELREDRKKIIQNNFSQVVETEDTRASYVQAIENLAYVLIPYFDENTKSVFDECNKIINGFDFEVKEILKEELARVKKEKENLNENLFFIEMRLRSAKKLFIELNMLLKRNDYLKSAVYGEDKDELVSDEDESEVLEND